MTEDDGLTPERATRIADAIDAIERNVSELRRHQDLSRAEYCAEENRTTRNAVERTFVKSTAAIVDVGETVLAIEGEPVPDHRKTVIDRLEQVDIFDEELARELRDAVGFRDVLAHTYGPIVNDDVVYDALQNSLDRYVAFAEAIQEYLSDRSE